MTMTGIGVTIILLVIIINNVIYSYMETKRLKSIINNRNDRISRYENEIHELEEQKEAIKDTFYDKEEKIIELKDKINDLEFNNSNLESDNEYLKNEKKLLETEFSRIVELLKEKEDIELQNKNYEAVISERDSIDAEYEILSKKLYFMKKENDMYKEFIETYKLLNI